MAVSKGGEIGGGMFRMGSGISKPLASNIASHLPPHLGDAIFNFRQDPQLVGHTLPHKIVDHFIWLNLTSETDFAGEEESQILEGIREVSQTPDRANPE